MPARINYITGRTSEFNEFRNGIPVHLEAGGFLLCTSGSGDMVVNSKQYSVQKGDLMVALPHSYVHALHASDDFDGVIFGVDIDILVNTEFTNRSFYLAAITNNPCISLTENEVRKILNLREIFLEERQDVDHPLRKEIDEGVLKIIIYEVAALFHDSRPNVEHESSRDDTIFSNFILQLHSCEPLNREVEYFAQKQSITSSHLSRVVKRVSGRTATEWIGGYTIITIKRLLQSADISIATIAERLNFPNASFLSQYFKRYTSQTPRQYRLEFFSAQ